MSDMLILCVVFILSFLAFLFVIDFAFAKNPLKQRLKKITNREKVEEPLGAKRPYVLLIKVLKGLSIIGSPKEEGESSFVQMRLLRAGYRGSNAMVIFYGLKVFLAVCFAALFLAVQAYWAQLSHIQILLGVLSMATAGLYLPNLWICLKARKRREKIREGFPDFLDLLVVCVEAGQGLGAAIHRVGKGTAITNKVLAEELKLLGLEMRAGKARSEALKGLAVRADIEEIYSFATLVDQTEKFGVSIAQALRVHSDSMRTRRGQRAEELAAKIPVKLIVPLILFILPTLFVVLIGPAIINSIREVTKSGLLG
jgi:tight adherence protein C